MNSPRCAARAPSLPRWALWGLALPLVLGGCVTDDTGKACTDRSVSLSADPISGENPVVEVVRVDRDATCESFQCLTHHGLPSYCSRSCTYNKVPKQAKTCAVDTDCTAPLHCFDGVCNDDDCPAGFWCRTVQDVGPLAKSLFCVRRDHCLSDFDCDEIGTIACQTLGCYDSCLTQTSSCAYHALTCSSLGSLSCTCADGTSKCTDSALQCRAPNASTALPSGSVTQVGVCLPK